MKLCTYDSGMGPQAGIVVGDRVLNAQTVLGLRYAIRDVQALLEIPEALTSLRSALASGTASEGDELASVTLRSPVLQPPTIRDFFVYEGHANGGGTRQLSDAWYRLPIFYFSNTLRVFGHEDVIPYPSATQHLDYELEIGIVIGKEGSNVTDDEAMDYIAGFTIFNDWSCRDLQRDESAAGLGPAKGKDSATTLGPYVVTLDELESQIHDKALHARCTLKVNGEQWMDNDASVMYHNWGAIIERASHDSRIVPGDVIGSGTVTGGSIGEAIRNGLPARYLEVGDVVEIEVEGLGVLRNRIGRPAIKHDANYRFAVPEGVFQPPTPLETTRSPF